jgi:hypothetical protein
MKSTILIFVCLCLSFVSYTQVSKTINVTSGGLYSALTVTEKQTISNLNVTGTIDASDFKTMRDYMPLLAVIDLSGTTITAYSGQLGTRLSADPINSYPSNTIPYFAFRTNNGNLNLISFKFPSGVTYIDEYAFAGCKKLSSLTIPSGVTYIGNAAFLDCGALITINFPSGVTKINDDVFSGSGLTSVDIPPTIITIGGRAFWGCTGLTSLKIPSSITTIDTQAFRGCIRLASIYVYSNPLIVLGSSTVTGSPSSAIFWEVNMKTCILYVPIGTLNDYRTAYQWKDFNNVVEFSTTGIEKFDTDKINIYPNPAIDGIWLDGIKGISKFSLTDINGKLILTKEINNNEYVSLNSLPKGIYFVNVNSNGETIDKKVIKN